MEAPTEAAVGQVLRRGCGGDQPAMIAGSAPADKQPGACLVNSDARLFDCAGKWEFAHRLCPCEAEEAAP